MFKNKNIFTSGWEFQKSELNLRSKFQMINIALLLSSMSLIFGILSNVYKETYDIIILECFIIAVNGIVFLYLRKCKDSFKVVSLVVSAQYSLFFLYLYYGYPPESLKFIWLFTYPIILLYFQEKKHAKYWMLFIVSMILIAPLQTFVEVDFSLFQSIYLSVVLMVVSVIIMFYQNKMDEAKDLIFEQQKQLQRQIDELTQKDKLLTIQSKQAVMGEMISMIAHQWRQPLSTVTLSISDIQVKKMLGTELDDEQLDDTLQSISDTVVYLSETIDDFQTYFNPNKEIHTIGIVSLINKAVNFTLPRLKNSKIIIDFKSTNDEKIETYTNELIQVILNILNNAIDELEKLSREKLSIIIDLEDRRDSFILSIIDNADGIDSENIESIFEPYYSTKGKNGTGLGLYMSQMIMQKQFDSKIEVSSSKDGSCFSMRVPKKLS
jgi:signal transduction histidine kinase